eukprot:m.186246 g.186246  ORF g.186246 m.186246 type:complete len:1172 (-) comp18491_c1_seq79:3356-6871(-)
MGRGDKKATTARPKRQSAQRAQSKICSMHDDEALLDDEFNFDKPAGRGYDMLEIIQSGRYKMGNFREMRSKDFTVEYIYRTGFRTPVRMKEFQDLGLQVPDASFTVTDVEHLVGSSTKVDAMDCETQLAVNMSLGAWVAYYTDPSKEKLLNVISLEISKTRLGRMIRAPEVVRRIDWIDKVWPVELKQQQRHRDNRMEHMKYPKVQKYCLMSVGGCYTDFHIDFGGTSVWYHVLRGTKIFFLIPPTEDNVSKFEKWSKENQELFFGEECSDCTMVTLYAGDTFMIPTGWIHAVYTPEDALVFGGNFLHALNVQGQLGIARLENRLKVPVRYRFPLFRELFWYAGQHYHRHLIRWIEYHRRSTGEAGSVIASPKKAAAVGDDDGSSDSSDARGDSDSDNAPLISTSATKASQKPQARKKRVSKAQHRVSVAREEERRRLSKFELRSLVVLGKQLLLWARSPRYSKSVPEEISSPTSLAQELCDHANAALAGEDSTDTSDDDHSIAGSDDVDATATPLSPSRKRAKAKRDRRLGTITEFLLDDESTLEDTSADGDPASPLRGSVSGSAARQSKYARAPYKAPAKMVERARQIRARVLAACSLKDRHASLARTEQHQRWSRVRRRVTERLIREGRQCNTSAGDHQPRPLCGVDDAPSAPAGAGGGTGIDVLVHDACGTRGSAGRRVYWGAQLGPEPPMREFFDWLAYNKVKWYIQRKLRTHQAHRRAQRDHFQMRQQLLKRPRLMSAASHAGGHSTGSEAADEEDADDDLDDDVSEDLRWRHKHPRTFNPATPHTQVSGSTSTPKAPTLQRGKHAQLLDTVVGGTSEDERAKQLQRQQRIAANRGRGSHRYSESLAFLYTLPGLCPTTATASRKTNDSISLQNHPPATLAGPPVAATAHQAKQKTGASHRPPEWIRLPDRAWLTVLQHLPQADTLRAGMICRRLRTLAGTHEAWRGKRADMSRAVVHRDNLVRMCRVNPTDVTFAWSTLSDSQLHELMLRCLRLGHLDLSGCRLLTQPCAWTSFASPPLVTLNLSFIPSVTDACVQALVCVHGTLRKLSLCGAPVSSAAVSALVGRLGCLEELDVYQCVHLDDTAFDTLPAATLRTLDARFTGASERLLYTLSTFPRLELLDMRDCVRLTPLRAPPIKFTQGAVVRLSAVHSYHSGVPMHAFIH